MTAHSPEPAHLIFSKDPTGAYISCGDQEVHLSDEQAAGIASALLSDQVEPVFVTLDPPKPKPGPSTVPKPSDIKRIPLPSSPATTPTPEADSRRGHHRSPLDLDSFPYSAEEAVGRRGSVSFVRSSEEWADRLGVDEERVLSICANPDDEWLSDNAEVFYVVGQGVGLTVSTDDGAVLGVRRAQHMGQFRVPDRQAPGIPRGRGGSGRRYPSDAEGLRRLLSERGFEVDVVGSGHQRVSLDRRSVNISSTPGDYRTVINEIKKIERHFGVSLAKES